MATQILKAVSSGHLDLGTEIWVPSSGYPDLGSQISVPHTQGSISDLRAQTSVPDLGSQVSVPRSRYSHLGTHMSESRSGCPDLSTQIPVLRSRYRDLGHEIWVLGTAKCVFRPTHKTCLMPRGADLDLSASCTSALQGAAQGALRSKTVLHNRGARHACF